MFSGYGVCVRDAIDEHVAQWQAELPDLDVRAEAIVARMQVLLRHLARRRQPALAKSGLELWQYKTLLELRRRGHPHRATPTELAAALDVSAPAMSKRIAALERSGFVRRTHDVGDRRRVHVTLTSVGKRAWARAAAAQEDIERELLSSLTPADQDTLAGLLRTLVIASDAQPLPQMRRSVGHGS